MIIAACNDDPRVVNLVRNASAGDAATFGRAYKIYDGAIPDLLAKEDLFIVAHGAAIGDEGQPVIGDKSDDFYLTARDLNTNLHIFPSGYSGRVFIYTCESALKGKDRVSFVEAYKAIVANSYPAIRVFGQIGKPSGPVPVPSDGSWTAA